MVEHCGRREPHDPHGNCAGTDNLGYPAEFGSCGKPELHEPHVCGEFMEVSCSGEGKDIPV